MNVTSGNADYPDAILELISAAADGCLAADDREELRESLRRDPRARAAYIEHAIVESLLLRKLHGERQVACVPPAEPAPPVVPTWTVLGNAWRGTASFFSEGFPLAYLLATVIVGTAIGIFSLIPVHHYVELTRNPSPPTVAQQLPPAERMAPVARVTGLVDCRWEKKGLGIRDWGLDKGSGAANPPSTIHHPKSPVRLGDKFALASGLLQLTYDTGAKVILQGPCTYEVDSPAGGFLSLGKLTARIGERGEGRGEREGTRAEGGPRRAEKAANPKSQISKSQISNPQSLIPNPSLPTTHYPLFTIKTPTATITDLGTEFGVEVDESGKTLSHVFRGLVRVRFSGAGGSESSGWIVRENETLCVDGAGERRKMRLASSAVAAKFVRQTSGLQIKILDLADVVAGGDGFSGKRNRGIDPASGLAVDTPPTGYPISDGKYHRVEAMPLVDGVFIPDGRVGPVQIDSAGHTYAWFTTGDNRTSGHIWAAGHNPAGQSSSVEVSSVSGIGRAELDGVDYASAGHGALLLHADKGITFDLEAIRRANPNCKILRFRATAGNTEPFSDRDKGVMVWADLWVLVDGQSRFRLEKINSRSGAFPVSVPIVESNRFLTLAATDGGNPIDADWIVFGDPRLELKSDGRAAAESRAAPPRKNP